MVSGEKKKRRPPCFFRESGGGKGKSQVTPENDGMREGKKRESTLYAINFEKEEKL